MRMGKVTQVGLYKHVNDELKALNIHTIRTLTKAPAYTQLDLCPRKQKYPCAYNMNNKFCAVFKIVLNTPYYYGEFVCQSSTYQWRSVQENQSIIINTPV